MYTPPRQHPRFAHEAAVTLSGGGHEVSGRTANISRGGLCAMLPATLAAGSRVDIEIALVFADQSTSEPLHLSGRVVWCTGLDKHYQIGLAFLPSPAGTLKHLDLFLQYLKEGQRQRR